MELAEKRRFIARIFQRYIKADRATKSRLLSEITEKLKIHRKSALRLLRVYRQRLKSGLKLAAKATSKKTIQAKAKTKKTTPRKTKVAKRLKRR